MGIRFAIPFEITLFVPTVIVVMAGSAGNADIGEDIKGAIVFVIARVPGAFLGGWGDIQLGVDILFGIRVVDLEHGSWFGASISKMG